MYPNWDSIVDIDTSVLNNHALHLGVQYTYIWLKDVKQLHVWNVKAQDPKNGGHVVSKLHYSKKLKEHVDIMIFIERYPLKRCQGCVKLIASKVNCFLNINDLSEVQLCMSSNSWTWECPHTKDGADHVPLIFWSSV